MITKIITHNGTAHLDEVLLLGLLHNIFSHRGLSIPVERKQPTEEELDDPSIMVVDVGSRLEPEKNNFDHHGLSEEGEPQCALSLFIRHTEINFHRWLDADVAPGVPSWYKVVRYVDVMGPARATAILGQIAGNFFQPLTTMFELPSYMRAVEIASDLWEIWRMKYDEESARLIVARQKGFKQVHSVAIIDDYEENIKYYEKAFQWSTQNPAIVIARSSLGTWILLRRGGAPTVDFSKLDGLAEYIHPSGHFAKVKDVVNGDELIDLALMTQI